MSRSSSHRPALLLTVCLVVMLLLGACADADTTAGAGSEATEAATTAPDPSSGEPTPDEASDAPTADGSETPVADAGASRPDRVTGTLGLEDVEGGCTTLTVDGERYELIADPDADIVIDSGNGVIATTDGEEIAQAGDTITVEGAVDTGMMTFCQIGPVFVAEAVTAE